MMPEIRFARSRASRAGVLLFERVYMLDVEVQLVEMVCSTSWNDGHPETNRDAGPKVNAVIHVGSPQR
jgi:hypothetical protein